MATTNVGWGAPRIHGELLKLGINICERTVQRYMPKREAPPEKDAPIPRAVEPSGGKVVSLPRVGGLHHRYSREEKLAA